LSKTLDALTAEHLPINKNLTAKAFHVAGFNPQLMTKRLNADFLRDEGRWTRDGNKTGGRGYCRAKFIGKS